MLFAVLLFGAAVLTECLVTRFNGLSVYSWHESERTLGLIVGWLLMAELAPLISGPIFEFSYEHRFLSPPSGSVSIILLLVGADFLYYWSHRLSHRFSWLWASHFAHHTLSRLNFLSSFRQGWTDLFSGIWLAWLPLALLGLPPETWPIYFVVLAAWQLWIYNEWVGQLGLLELFLVTPSHHRIHHSLAQEHRDRNYGGVLIIWDRLFGTFVAEGSHRISAFGIPDMPDEQASPAAVAFSQWRAMLMATPVRPAG